MPIWAFIEVTPVPRMPPHNHGECNLLYCIAVDCFALRFSHLIGALYGFLESNWLVKLTLTPNIFLATVLEENQVKVTLLVLKKKTSASTNTLGGKCESVPLVVHM